MSHVHDSADANARLVRKGFEQFNANNLDGCLALTASDLIMHLAEAPEPIVGRDAWREGATMIKTRLSRSPGRDRGHRRRRGSRRGPLRFRGTHEGEYLGFRPTGRTITYVSHEFYRVADGAIAEQWICSDTETLFRQIG
jgi:SnoaL-like polyketide cyclase